MKYLDLMKWFKRSGEEPAGAAPEPSSGHSLGRVDIPRWVGLLLFVAVIYLTSSLPSEMKPLPIIDTVPYSGEHDVPLTTDLEVQLQPGGFKEVFGDGDPAVVLTCDNIPATIPISTTVSHAGDTLHAVLRRPLWPGCHVRVAARTRYGRDLIWTFYTIEQQPGATPTPLPPLIR